MQDVATMEVGPPTPPPGSQRAARHVAAGAFVGRVLGGTYHVTSVIEEGGMGTVLGAEHMRLRRPVAIKVLAPHLVANRQSRARFEREAAIISALRHPHVVHVLDFDIAPGGVPYLVMELLEGMTLRRMLERHRRIDLATCARVVRQIASALAAAHAAQVVHRDLKPSNVFVLDAPGEPLFIKLLDFGVSKFGSGGHVGRLTGECDVVGTPHYMAPEQARGAKAQLDHRADQFALGVITYEMLTGRLPFTGNTLRSLLFSIINETHPPLEAMGLPPQLDMVLARALAKNPEERFDNVMTYADTLGALALTSSTQSMARQGRITPPDVTHTVLEAIDEARRVHAEGFVHEAAELAERALTLVEGSGETDAAAVARLTGPLLENIFLHRLGGLARHVRVVRPLLPTDEGMSPRIAFVASRLVGDLTIGDVLDVCVLPRLATLRSIAHLANEGVVELWSP